MPARNRTTIRTAEQPVSSIGERMGTMREWLDHRRIQLTDFRLTPLPLGSVAFDASFHNAREAALFRATFC